MKITLLYLGIILTLNFPSSAQNKRICLVGSSTSYGYGVPADSSYAGRIKNFYKTAGVLDTLYNIAVPGIDCYIGMPTSFVPPPGRNAPNPQFNITRAIHFDPKPDVIIVNFPSNNYQWMPYAEIIFCLQTMKDSANAAGIACYITTTQPRDDFNPAGGERQRLKDLELLIKQNFGNWALNFWEDIVQDPPIIIKPQFALGDNVHLNPAGHAMLANIVLQKNILFAEIGNRWTGVKNEDWADAANWITNKVPVPTEAVVIPSGRPHYPIIQADVAIKKLTCEDGATITVGSNHVLQIISDGE